MSLIRIPRVRPSDESVMVSFGDVKNVHDVDDTQVTVELIYATDPTMDLSTINMGHVTQTIGGEAVSTEDWTVIKNVF